MTDRADAPPSSVSDLISRWESIAAFAEDVACGYEAARKMRMRESISVEHWHRVVEAATLRGIQGITLAWLMERGSRRSVKSGRSATIRHEKTATSLSQGGVR